MKATGIVLHLVALSFVHCYIFQGLRIERILQELVHQQYCFSGGVHIYIYIYSNFACRCHDSSCTVVSFAIGLILLLPTLCGVALLRQFPPPSIKTPDMEHSQILYIII